MNRSGAARAAVTAVAIALAVASLRPAAAEEFRVTATIEPSGVVSDSQPLRLVIRVEGSRMPEVSAPLLPALENLRVISGPSSSRNTAFRFDGTRSQSSASVTLTYTLLPEEPGTAVIPPIEVPIGSTTYRTSAITVQVRQGTTGPPTPAPAAPRGQPSERAGQPADVFLRAELSSDEVWANETVLLTVTLYTATQIGRFNWIEIPDLSGFWVEDQTLDPMAERFSASFEGRRYTGYPVTRKVLVPTSAGERTIDPFSAQVSVRRRSRDLFDELFSMGSGPSVVRKTVPVTLRVRPLPTDGKPSSFSGAVGDFRLRAKLDRSEAAVNDAVALTVTVEGEGSLRSVAPPVLEPTTDIKFFEPEVRNSSEVVEGRLRSRRTWEWVMVPLVPGDLRVPPVRFSFFDAARGTYRELRTDDLTVAVRKADGPSEAPIARNFVRPQRRDIAFIKVRRGSLESPRPRLHARPWFVVALVLPAFLAPVVILVARHRARVRSDRTLFRARRAKRRARRRLRVAQQRSGRMDTGTFHEEVSRALVEYVADRFGRPPAGMTYDLAEELLATRGVTPELRRRFRSCLETCDFARFVPASGQEGRRTEVLKEAKTVIDQVEAAL